MGEACVTPIFKKGDCHVVCNYGFMSPVTEF